MHIIYTNMGQTEVVGDYTMVNLFIFVVMTILYYAFLKPRFSVADIENEKSITDVISNQNYMSGIYFLVVLLFQFVLNTMSLVGRCGDGTGANIAAAAYLTFVPWVLIFGVMMVVIMAFPGMKSGFSDVIGYIAVSYSANKVVTELMIDPEVDRTLTEANVDEKSRMAMQDTAQTILRILGNTSVLINQVVPANFGKFWNTMIPLMKPKYKDNMTGEATQDIKKQILELANLRDNIGESCWYIYTGIFLIMIVQYNILTHKCTIDPRIMNEKYDDYLKEQKKEERKKKQANSITYKL